MKIHKDLIFSYISKLDTVDGVVNIQYDTGTNTGKNTNIWCDMYNVHVVCSIW